MIAVEPMDGGSSSVPFSALQLGFREAAAGQEAKSTDAATQKIVMQTQHYSPHARLCMVRVSLAQSRELRESIERMRFIQQRRVQLKIVRAFGNARLARRDFARRLEEVLQTATDGKARKALRTLLGALADLQKR